MSIRKREIPVKMYKVVLSNKVIKEIDKLPEDIFQKVDKVIQDLKLDPRPVGSIKLTGSEGYRIKVSRYRILYTIEKKKKEIRIYGVLHRKDAYKKK